ncbi:MAG TPA: GIY-YIG nuclease family protein [Candidatus Fermentibacter daniensis]|jgi:predicted GIY-YIG superfamily endonuclease|nr:MAG: hypothetical protein AO396_10360 [Candidatus Fermentibacter daniensis]KZD18906.1 MAG: hypothetical protein AO394_10590 [Candidatus Fermentibacter daniensis]HOD19701.1 GIY-YIG nuclease family protein [Candidatus Fermentibacter daniensis]HPH38887.1 GIY-YIG nuclease family protein [Candidatus Fermentibacter daniensis]HPN61643.1 GIY-YIG nuclease family protein [Candidatus Fermentibacter daniensis]
MYNLYVIELDPRVLIYRKFRDANPDRREDKPCVYVGSTALTPEERFIQHKNGTRSNRYARRFGVRLRPRLYKNYQGIATRKLAELKEKRLAERLRKRGYAVWYGI